MTDAQSLPQSERGRAAAFVVYGLYILSIPSAAVLALLGLVVAYASRDSADQLARAHLDAQIRLFWIAAMWNVAVFVASLVAWVLVIVLIGIPLLWLLGVIWFVVMLWFTVKSVLGAVALIDRREA